MLANARPRFQRRIARMQRIINVMEETPNLATLSAGVTGSKESQTEELTTDRILAMLLLRASERKPTPSGSELTSPSGVPSLNGKEPLTPEPSTRESDEEGLKGNTRVRREPQRCHPGWPFCLTQASSLRRRKHGLARKGQHKRRGN
ncbi:hypothetical protein OS493_037323 [Desmophyllum pertusum]|uniref:Uncharacterized protein n=1 Tax=Desmophyllum pertusum TaxID=174260 RepID=A0A9W9Z7X8_9CNID|nr:hypothetical protein OS493_037323 [Desmophyllum pertusum]